jgi:hypothetical protein
LRRLAQWSAYNATGQGYQHSSLAVTWGDR